jgi:hypothetical protein
VSTGDDDKSDERWNTEAEYPAGTPVDYEVAMRIINFGVAGGRRIQRFLRSLRPS